MKKIILFLTLILFPLSLFAQPSSTFVLTVSGDTGTVYTNHIGFSGANVSDVDSKAIVKISTTGGGSGDMLKTTYDTDVNNKVDDCDKIGTLTATKWCIESSGKITCTENAPAGSGDVTDVGNCTGDACFTGVSGDTVTFNNAGGDATIAYDGSTFTFSKFITSSLTGAVTGTASGNALPALSNLASVACNLSLVSDTANTDDLGTEALYWKKLYLASDISFEGATDDTYQTTLTAVDTTLSDKSINIPNAGGTMAVSATAPATLSVLGDIGITVLKDLVTTAPLTGGTNDILVGTDADITIAIPQATTSVDGYVVQADWDSWTDHVADNTQAHSDYVINSGDTITGAVTINDNNAAGSTLLTIGDATDADSVAIFGDLTVTGGDITLGTSLIFSGGDTTSLNLIDAIDATTEATIEGAIDTLANLAEGGLADQTIVSADIKEATILTGDIAADTITHANIADADQADTKCFYFEDPTADDDFKSIWANKTANDFLLTEIWAESDQTVTFMLQVDDGTPADVDSVDLAPAAGEAEDTSLDGDTTVAAGEELDLAVTSVANTPTWCSICFTGNWVD